MSRTARQAIAWARARKGDYGWDNLCLSFVRQSFGIYYSPDSSWPNADRNAGTAWDRARKKHHETDPSKIPAGVPVFFEMPTVADHVVLSTGGGRCISNDFVVDGRIDEVRIADIAARWGQLQGWTEDLVGNDIYQEPKPPVPDFTDLTFQHTSMQFSDGDKAMERDVKKIFSRERMFLSGTEAGSSISRPLQELLRAAAHDKGYRLYRKNSLWLAVHRDVIKDGWKTGSIPVLRANEGYGPHVARGIDWVSFNMKHVGKVTFGVGHYLTHGREPRNPNYDLNTRYAEAIGAWARLAGEDQDVVFYAGDQNVCDRKNDSFRGSPLTSCWDELEHWPRPGPDKKLIDVVASYDRDGRVTAKGARIFDDTELHLYTDHPLVEAEYRVRHLKEKR